MQIRDLTRGCFVIAHVNEPVRLAVGRIQEWNAVAIPISNAIASTLRITLGLFQHILGTDGQTFGFDYTEHLSIYEQRVISRAIGC